MGSGNVRMNEKVGEEGEPENCTYCGDHLEKFAEFFPHEAGGYCIFAPRKEIDYACEKCAFKTCDDCGENLPRFMFKECEKCQKTHCFNNTDMIYPNNPALRGYTLCEAMNCEHNNDKLDNAQSKSESDNDELAKEQSKSESDSDIAI